MEFKKQLVETADTKILRGKTDLYSDAHPFEDFGFRMFQGIPLKDGIVLSVQGSYAHYSTPRKTVPLDQYTELEVAIFKDDEFTTIENVTTDKALIEAFNEDFTATVYPFVGVEHIEKLYLLLREEPTT